jgi:hypothetical protein
MWLRSHSHLKKPNSFWIGMAQLRTPRFSSYHMTWSFLRQSNICLHKCPSCILFRRSQLLDYLLSIWVFVSCNHFSRPMREPLGSTRLLLNSDRLVTCTAFGSTAIFSCGFHYFDIWYLNNIFRGWRLVNYVRLHACVLGFTTRPLLNRSST